MFSEITPKAQILTCVADHFEDRFPLEIGSYMIKRIKYVLYTELGKDGDLCGESFLMRERQRIYRKRNGNMSFLWKRFFHSVSIKERENPKCQQAHLPFRYRGGNDGI